jgi:lipoyl(octanoyl) transferase
VNQTAKICWVSDLGLIPYAAACRLQRVMVQARKSGDLPDVLLLCEHPHVITLGRNGRREHLLASERLLAQMNVEYQLSDRGGDITYHGPGQIVGYPILDLAELRRDVRWYVERLEEIMIGLTAEFGLAARRSAAGHGIWIDAVAGGPAEKGAGEEKLAALGVHLSRWVSSHGFAYNVATDLRYFDLIVPCGLAGKRATSLERALGRSVNSSEVADRLVKHFGTVFGRQMLKVSRDELEERIAACAVRPSSVWPPDSEPIPAQQFGVAMDRTAVKGTVA